MCCLPICELSDTDDDGSNLPLQTYDLLYALNLVGVAPQRNIALFDYEKWRVPLISALLHSGLA